MHPPWPAADGAVLFEGLLVGAAGVDVHVCGLPAVRAQELGFGTLVEI